MYLEHSPSFKNYLWILNFNLLVVSYDYCTSYVLIILTGLLNLNEM